jgi:hypothetical protein
MDRTVDDADVVVEIVVEPVDSVSEPIVSVYSPDSVFEPLEPVSSSDALVSEKESCSEPLLHVSSSDTLVSISDMSVSETFAQEDKINESVKPMPPSIFQRFCKCLHT